MLSEWTYWLSSVHPDELFLLLAPLLLLDAPRYALAAVVLWCVDCAGDVCVLLKRCVGIRPEPLRFTQCPRMCVVVAGLNESATVGPLLSSIWGSYPRLEIIVCDDGSTDGMSRVARDFARHHAGVRVLTKPRRGGKSSALNFALPFTTAEIIVCIDGDSHLGENALWEIVQPFADPRVWAVSGTVLARNPQVNLATRCQALEYLRNIFVGRMVASRLGILGIVSGAFGAFRRDALARVGAWDVGPGEDGDLALRLRKCGYAVVFAPYAQCLTNLPTSWYRLLRQRRRWEWATITLECRKHLDLANPFARHFRVSNLFLLAERWLFGVLQLYWFVAFCVWITFRGHDHIPHIALLYYLVYLALECVQLGVALCYTPRRGEALIVGLATPLMPFYALYLRLVSLIAITEEIFTRRSYRDGFVPEHVREATWHW